ncbi:hypothetical protein K438DRAFT_1997104 [Mycena galopus ATCC 62051]|nr:hypothetical protein K438DRAFT_1997104 [Mycena galopus ATCC 62051]
MAYRDRELGWRHEDAQRRDDQFDEVHRRNDKTRCHGEGPRGTDARRREGDVRSGGHCGPRHDVHHRSTRGGPDRAREQQLREHALHTKGSTGTKPGLQPTRPVPNVDEVSHRAHGHPVPPVAAAADDESDYGSSGVEEDSELLKFRTHEHDRLAKCHVQDGQRTSDGPTPQSAWRSGPVGGAVIQ